MGQPVSSRATRFRLQLEIGEIQNPLRHLRRRLHRRHGFRESPAAGRRSGGVHSRDNPQNRRPAFKTDVTLLADDGEVARRSVGLGDFQFFARVKNQPGKRRVTVAFDASQQLPAADGRTLGARLKFLGFSPRNRPAFRPTLSRARICNIWRFQWRWKPGRASTCDCSDRTGRKWLLRRRYSHEPSSENVEMALIDPNQDCSVANARNPSILGESRGEVEKTNGIADSMSWYLVRLWRLLAKSDA
jgi:hypothetical protein